MPVPNSLDLEHTRYFGGPNLFKIDCKCGDQ